MDTNLDEARAFLQVLFRHADPNWWIRFWVAKPGTKIVDTLWARAPDFAALPAIVDYNRNGYSVYVSVNPYKAVGHGGREWVAARTALVIDVDEEKDNVSGPKIAEVLVDIGLSPSVVIDSGHGAHFYYVLDRAMDVDGGEQLNKWLIEASIVSDPSVWNSTRLMRLPGTFNLKRNPAEACRVLVANHDLTYDPGEIAKRLRRAGIPEPWQAEYVPDRRPHDPERVEHILAYFVDQYPDLFTMITTGEPIPGMSFTRHSGSGFDRSAADFYVITRLMQEGASDDDVRQIYLSQAISRLKVDSEGEHYLDISIRNARKRVGSTEAVIPHVKPHVAPPRRLPFNKGLEKTPAIGVAVPWTRNLVS